MNSNTQSALNLKVEEGGGSSSRHWSGSLDDDLPANINSGSLANMENNSFGAHSSTSGENGFMDSFTKFLRNPASSSYNSDDDDVNVLTEKKLLSSGPPPAPPPSSVSSSTCSSVVPKLTITGLKTQQDSSSESASSSESDYEDQLKKRTKKKTRGHHKKLRKLNGGSEIKKLNKHSLDPGFGSSQENGMASLENGAALAAQQNLCGDDGPVVKRKLGRPTLAEAARKRQNFPQSPRIKIVEANVSKEPAFLQNVPCFEVGAKLSRCRECRLPSHQRNKKMPNIMCRFYHFRKLRITKNGISSGGFAEPADCTEEDLSLWMPAVSSPPQDINVDTARFLLTHVGDQFCDLVSQEKEAKSLHMGPPDFVAWKRVVSGVREMCDVCETTIFNAHWVCRRCGFVVCIDCYKARKAGIVREEEEMRDRDEFQWLLCTNRQVHDQAKMMLTEIVAGSALEMISEMLHEVRRKWDIPSSCHCPLNNSRPPPPSIAASNNATICKQLVSSMKKIFSKFRPQILPASRKPAALPLSTPANAAAPISTAAPTSTAATTIEDTHTPPPPPPSQESQSSVSWMSNALGPPHSSSPCSLLELKEELQESEAKAAASRCSVEHQDLLKEAMQHITPEDNDKLFHKRFPAPEEPLPVRTCTLSESQQLYPKVPHTWLCNGKLLLLSDPLHPKNLDLFQEQWKRGQPVLVGDVSGQLDMTLWTPEGFARDFGEISNDLVNCRTGAIIPDLPMKKFWEGFENFSKRLMDENGEHMLLKLKDWPPGEDFSELLPDRFQDLMKALPLAHYTHRDGALNLAARLPPCFVRPDLGPKMYNAYGSALYPTKGTTNLHLDISDAVNVMVYVGMPNDAQEDINEALKAIDEGGCDSVTRRRVREKGVRPGALWHIYNARDADKIRQLLNKVAVEKGEKLEAHHDPIHDQSWYLEDNLRRRLYREYGVTGYAIAQCLGDAVFIPAGAPHQVRNLHSCVKVAEDFVSPENIGHCFTLTQEFRDLSDTHTNHEDKLQIKNIIYHTVRDALAHLIAEEGKTTAAVTPALTAAATPAVTAAAASAITAAATPAAAATPPAAPCPIEAAETQPQPTQLTY